MVYLFKLLDYGNWLQIKRKLLCFLHTSRGRVPLKLIVVNCDFRILALFFKNVAVIVVVRVCRCFRFYRDPRSQLAVLETKKKEREKNNQLKLNEIKPSIIVLDSLTF